MRLLEISAGRSHLWDEGLFNQADGNLAAGGAVLADNLIQLLLVEGRSWAGEAGVRGDWEEGGGSASPLPHIELVDVNAGVAIESRTLQLVLQRVHLLALRRLDELDDLEKGGR